MGLLYEDYKDFYSIFLNKEYQNLAQNISTIYPKKLSAKVILSTIEKRWKYKIRADPVVVVNYFGRLCVL